jgi:hypothetical protein
MHVQIYLSLSAPSNSAFAQGVAWRVLNAFKLCGSLLAAAAD